MCDFGLARHVSSVGSLTGDRGFVGTVDYVAPEQIRGGSVDGRADLYALGCVLFECIAGERPYERDSELAVVFAHLNEPPPRLTDVRPELPTVLDHVIGTAMAKSPRDRYRTAGELYRAADAAIEGAPRAAACAAAGAACWSWPEVSSLHSQLWPRSASCSRRGTTRLRRRRRSRRRRSPVPPSV